MTNGHFCLFCACKVRNSAINRNFLDGLHQSVVYTIGIKWLDTSFYARKGDSVLIFVCEFIFLSVVCLTRWCGHSADARGYLARRRYLQEYKPKLAAAVVIQSGE